MVKTFRTAKVGSVYKQDKNYHSQVYVDELNTMMQKVSKVHCVSQGVIIFQRCKGGINRYEQDKFCVIQLRVTWKTNEKEGIIEVATKVEYTPSKLHENEIRA